MRKVHHNHIKYRVGQVVKHKRHDLHGVIIGWDEKASATNDWITTNYNEEEVIIFKNNRKYY